MTMDDVKSLLAIDIGSPAAERNRLLDEVEARLPAEKGTYDYGNGYYQALADVRAILCEMRGQYAAQIADASKGEPT